MREMHVMVADVLSAEMDALYRRHGPWSLMRALVVTVARRSVGRAVNRSVDLDNHMRRDIGLPPISPEVDRVLEARFEHWRHYL
ncbi:hypothetical protein SAMN03159496_03644 [Rhizobium sp. NFR07]|uniref:hypothetical protein n=1 Tax=Rhizobium sp. NFR07 TaxID=1566262 RepID=UPI0008E76137|nr:hypothetical protein [Rhizobium sp. NFR07]SFB42935.1 hypothetical protein SAMN03159496_03644 [Rhizobium sp. NFR07]